VVRGRRALPHNLLAFRRSRSPTAPGVPRPRSASIWRGSSTILTTHIITDYSIFDFYRGSPLLPPQPLYGCSCWSLQGCVRRGALVLSLPDGIICGELVSARYELLRACPGNPVEILPPVGPLVRCLCRNPANLGVGERRARQVGVRPIRPSLRQHDQIPLKAHDYDCFLRSCAMQAHLFEPITEASIKRCLELIQRSNQLNLSTRRYDLPEFQHLLAAPDVLAIALACEDRFGDYGIVGFASVEVDDARAMLRDFVVSCRIAKKKVEHAWFQWIANYLTTRAYDRLFAVYRPTSRNLVLFNTLREIGFVDIGAEGEGRLLELDLRVPIEGAGIVGVRASGFGAPASQAGPVAVD
jgi:hypothetical protein